MILKKYLLLTFITLLIFCIYAQTGNNVTTVDEIFGSKGEIYFKFENKEINLEALSKMISIDKVNRHDVFAYANKTEFGEFLKQGIDFELLPKPGELTKEIKMLDNVNVKGILDWDFYPTYPAYVDMMYQFASEYPQLCQVFSIGQSIQGRELLMAKVSKNVQVREAEPQFLYTGTMHGDETTGYILLLRLIDYLLSNYGTNSKVTNLLDNSEIWINPLSNPDGTYKGGNNSVYGATRYNANNVDLNRNYPDPEDGPHPDGNEWQPETVAFMQLAEEQHFVMSANTHGGAEVLNYPWDTWSPLPADNTWWVFVCRQYVDTVHLYSPPNYMNQFNNGIINGYSWYSISGGRQDYMNYFHNCREVTMEISNVKLLPTSQLENHWNWNYRSLLNYLEQSLYGVNGTVTNITTGQPINAKITIEGHDIHNSFVFSEQQTGFYQRLLDAGTYNLTFTAPGYYPVVINNVNVTRYNTVNLNVEMDAGELEAGFSASETTIAIGDAINFTDESYGAPVSWSWSFSGGIPSTSNMQHPQNITYPNAGSFPVSLTVANENGETNTITKEDYITVNATFLMSNQTVTICNGIFYDSGGDTGNYSNNEDYLMTFKPETAGANIIVQFIYFDVEYNSTCNWDWLKIYNGINTSASLIGTYCGTNSPGTIEASNDQGALTFQFHSDYSVNKSGWKAILSCSFVGLPPIADFSANQNLIYRGDTVMFTDLSTNNPTSWSWSFEGGTPPVSNLQNPSITYYELGEFDVKLIVQNDYGIDSLLIQNFIKVDSGIGIEKRYAGNVSVYPNPVKNDKITITSDMMIKEVKVIDLFGSLIKYEKDINATNVRLDMSQIRSGVYLVEILDDFGCRSIKITVIK